MLIAVCRRVDGEVLGRGVAVARRLGVPAEVVHVHDGFPDLVEGSLKEPLPRGPARHRITFELHQTLRERGFDDVAVQLIVGSDPVEAIREMAHPTKDLLVMGASLKGTVERVLRGSVAHGLLEAAPCSVLVVRPSGRGAAPWSRAQICVDLTPRSVVPILIASPLARALSLRPDLVHVVATSASGLGTGAAVRPVTEARDQLGSLRAHHFDDAGLVTVTTSSAIADELLAHAKRTAVDLIVVGHRPSLTLTERLLGRVSTRLVSDAPCSVLVAR